jgi:hypothetical protein
VSPVSVLNGDLWESPFLEVKALYQVEYSPCETSQTRDAVFEVNGGPDDHLDYQAVPKIVKLTTVPPVD